MRRQKHVAMLALGLTLCGGLAGAEDLDLSGEWTLRGESPEGREVAPMTFTTDGHDLVAIMKGEASDVECQGVIDGNKIRFYYIRSTPEGKFVAKYTGHVKGNAMGGEVDLGEHGKTTWKATRESAHEMDLSGAWTLRGESPAGREVVPVTFSVDNHHLVVTMKGQTSDVECQGVIDGNELRFYYIRSTAEGEFKATYAGHVAGNVMGGEVDLGEHGKTTWKATRN